MVNSDGLIQDFKSDANNNSVNQFFIPIVDLEQTV